MQRLVVCLLVLGAAYAVLGCHAKDGGTVSREEASPAAVSSDVVLSEVVYSVQEYNPSRESAADLAATVVDAKAGNKRILLQVGGEWCGWCHRLDKYVVEHPAVASALRDHFIIMKVNHREENKNEEFLSQYPQVDGYPHLFVLDGDGTFLHSQGTAELEDDDSYSEAALLEFLNAWKG